MWEYDGFQGKAQLYFSRAASHPTADDAVLAHWLLLGLEFLLRAPLAKIHPVLLADPTGDSVMAAAGFTVDPGKVKSIQTKTVIDRLVLVIPEFRERHKDALVLTGLRNEEMHSSASPYECAVELWLPHFTRVVEVVCKHLDLDPAEMLGPEIFQQGRELVDAADQKLQHEIGRRLENARAFRDRLTEEEVAARQRRYADATVLVEQYTDGTTLQPVLCPGCAETIHLNIRPVRTTNERLDDDYIVKDIVYIAVDLSCPICGLTLNNPAEIRAAGIQQQYIREERESLEDRYAEFDEPDYGND